MGAGSRVQIDFRRELRRVRRGRVAERAAAGLFAAGLLVLAMIGASWLRGGGPPDASLLLRLWLPALGLAAAVAATGLRIGRDRRRRVARAFDRRAGARGAILAALDAAGPARASRYFPLLEHRAARLGQAAPPSGARRLSAVPLVGALGCLTLSLLLSLLRGPLPGRLEAPVHDPLRKPAPEAAAPEAPAGTATAVPELGELARLELATERRIFLPREEPQCWITLRQRGGVGERVPLETILTLADGLPSPDVGLGVGIRPLPLDLPFALEPTPGEPTRHRVSLRPALERYGMWRPGLVTIRALARVGDGDQDRVTGGLASNQITIQIAENRERQRIRKPTPTETARNPKKNEPDPQKEEKSQGNRGGGAPELGDPDRLPEARRKATAVKPLISDGPRVEKEVNVFERERGGEAAPPPRARPLPDSPERTFLQRAEAEIVRLPLSPEDRVLLRRYFERLRQ